jgi:hypothetical protein
MCLHTRVPITPASRFGDSSSPLQIQEQKGVRPLYLLIRYDQSISLGHPLRTSLGIHPLQRRLGHGPRLPVLRDLCRVGHAGTS